ncbi:MAG: golvesin C-terminal-like domain-containing protein, partial [Planctomycetota bacterium]
MSRCLRPMSRLKRIRLLHEALEPRYLLSFGELCLDAPYHADPAFDPAADIFAPVEAATSQGSGQELSGLLPLSAIPLLDSLPGADASLYLDFDGHFDAQWGGYSNVTTPAFDQDGDPNTFSDGELATITRIWEYVAEDYAPFHLNVTTVEPGSFANGDALRVAIGGSGGWTGGTYGGVAYVNSFTNSITNTVYVFENNLANGNARYTAEASSHEAGHGFGLRHQSLYDANGSKVQEYYVGPGDGRAPIMGESNYATRGIWWYGTSTSASTYQDDMALLARSANGFGYRADDHGDTAGTATPLAALDGQLSGQGLISTTDDLDVFSFQTGSGQIIVSVDVPAYVNNLDARLELRDASGNLVAEAAPTGSFGASITTTVGQGSYQLVAASNGGYGDVGQYTVSGTIVPTGDSAELLLVSLNPAAISENGGTATGTVTRSGDMSGALTVGLSSSDVTAATVPLEVTIPAGQASATFSIDAVDDQAADGTQTTTITATASGYLDGVGTLEVTDDEVPAVLIVDDGDSGYGETGTGWDGNPYSTKYRIYENDTRWHAAGTGLNAANWDFAGLDPGQYKVSVTWLENTNRATNAPYTVYDGTTAEGTIVVNQQLAPSSIYDSWPWEDLGIFNVDGTTLRVQLTDDANGFVMADGVRIERVGDLVDALTVAIAPAVISENGGAATGTVTRSGDTSGALTVSLSNSDPTAATVPLEVTILAGQASATFAIDAVDDSVADGTQTTTITATAAGCEDGVGTLEVTDDDDVSAVLIVDDGDSGYSETGTGWDGNPYSTKYRIYENDTRWHAAGSGLNAANWDFASLDPGQYKVSVTWLKNTNRATNAPYTVYDGTTAEGTILVNQQLAPSATYDSWLWEDLGTFDVAASTLRVQLTDAANGYVMADAVRIERVGNLVDALTVAIAPAVISEDGGAATGTVTRPGDTSGALTVGLSSSDPTAATVPLEVTILAGQASVTFAITAVDDSVVDGTQTTTITASATGYEDGVGTLEVTDDDEVPAVLIVDDGDSGYSETGTGWDGNPYSTS